MELARSPRSHSASVRGRAAVGVPAEQEKSAADVAETSSIRIVCRLRPMSDRERQMGAVPVASASTERREVAIVKMASGGGTGACRQVRSTFSFDHVLSSFSTQSEVFACTLEPLIRDVLAGFEATAFAYGQTGTGKTYTMEGDIDCEDSRGLVPRAAAAIVDALASQAFIDSSITVSYMEIYNEEIFDLLTPADRQQKLDLQQSGRKVCCAGLSEVAVSSLAEILQFVRLAQEKRKVAETRVNARSSRSHSIFTMKVACRRRVAAGVLENIGKLHLVDLAGSECAKKAIPTSGGQDMLRTSSNTDGASDMDRERKAINQSLLTLGRVITALRDDAGRVPYRDSKLTRILQDALGGHCKTVLIATVSPAMAAVEETLSTLLYAEQASGVKNRPVASSMFCPTGRLGAAFRNDGSMGIGSGSGASDWAALELKNTYLQQEVEEAKMALARHQAIVEELEKRADTAEAEWKQAQDQVQKAKCSFQALRDRAHASMHLLGEEVAKSTTAALATRGRVQACFDGEVLRPCGFLLEALQASAKDAKAHTESLERELVQAKQNRAQADARHELFGKGIQGIIDGRGTATERSLPLERDLEMLAQLAAQRSELGASSGAKVAAGLSAAVSTLRASSKTADIHAEVKLADEVLMGACSNSQTLLSSLKESLKNSAVRQRTESAASTINQDISVTGEALQNSLTSAGEALAEARSAIAVDIQELQKQRAAEQEIVMRLAKQREALEADVASAQESLASIWGEVEDAKAALSHLQEEQTVAREQALRAAMGGIEALLRGELNSLGSKLSDGLDSVTGTMTSIRDHASNTSDLLGTTKVKSADEVRDLTGMVSSWAAGVDKSCNSIIAAQQSGAEAAQSVETAAASARDKLKQVNMTVARWGAVCEDLALAAESATERVCALEDVNNNCSLHWSTAKGRVGAAVEACTAEVCAITEDMSQLHSEAHAITHEFSQLGQEVAAQCVGARGHIKVWSDLSTQDTESFLELAAQHANHFQADAIAETRRQEMGEVLAGEASMLAATTSDNATRATEILAAIKAHSTASAEELEKLISMFKESEASANNFLANCRLDMLALDFGDSADEAALLTENRCPSTVRVKMQQKSDAQTLKPCKEDLHSLGTSKLREPRVIFREMQNLKDSAM